MSINQNDYELTPEELEVEQIIEDGTRQLEQIDYKIQDLEKKSGPSLTPSWSKTYTLTPAEKTYQKKILANNKELVKAETKDKVAKKLEKCPIAVQLRGFSRAERWAEPDRDLKEKLLNNKSVQRDITESQTVTMSQLTIEKKIDDRSFADRFNSSLKSNNVEPSPNRTKSFEERDKNDGHEEVEPEKD